MRPTFNPRLINGPFDDPGIYVPFAYDKKAILFDAGQLHSLATKDILKISHVFVTHTHMDHFMGFDRLLRLFLGRDKTLYVFGPKGIVRNIEGKLAGYTWNLVQEYPFILDVTEIQQDRLSGKVYYCEEGFLPGHDKPETPFDTIVWQDSGVSVGCVILDHRIPCLGFSLDERYHINIIKENLDLLGLKQGPWLSRFKQVLYDSNDKDITFNIDQTQSFPLNDLASKITMITPGQKISYITDVIFSPANEDKIVNLVKGSDMLFIEASFLETENELARQKYHLTAYEAGLIARKACVKSLSVFHFSPRYMHNSYALEQEAMNSFNNNM